MFLYPNRVLHACHSSVPKMTFYEIILVWSCISSLFDILYPLLLSVMPFVFKISICYLVTVYIDCLRFEVKTQDSRHQTIGPLSCFLRAYWWLKANLWLSTCKMEITWLQFICLPCHHQSNIRWKSQSLKKWGFFLFNFSVQMLSSISILRVLNTCNFNFLWQYITTW